MIRIERRGIEVLPDYEQISIAFEVETRLSLPALKIGRFVEDSVEPFVKDYDLSEVDRPTALPDRLGADRLLIWVAFHEDDLVGGAILYLPTDDQAMLIDIRVEACFRRGGIGRQIIGAVRDGAAQRQIPSIEIETQDTNVAACRFYSKLGATLIWMEPNGYPGFSDEAKLIWSLEAG